MEVTCCISHNKYYVYVLYVYHATEVKFKCKVCIILCEYLQSFSVKVTDIKINRYNMFSTVPYRLYMDRSKELRNRRQEVIHGMNWGKMKR